MKFDQEYIEQLVIDQLAGTISAEDEAILQKAIADDEAIARLWQDYSKALSLYKAESHPLDKSKAWEKVQEGIDQKTGATVIPLTPYRKRNIVVVAASVACLLVILSSTLFLINKNKSNISSVPSKKEIEIILANGKKITIQKGGEAVQTDAAQLIPDSNALHYSLKNGILDTSLNTLLVPRGLDYALTLSDGTKVWVNAATQIKFPLNFPGGKRRVELNGEAYFEVAKDKTRPFIVHTDNMDVQVYGTSFNIKAYPNEAIQASLLEGKIEAKTPFGKLMLAPGKAALFSNNSLQETSFNEKNILAWRKGYYFFENESIASINNTVERWFGYHLQYDQADIAQIRFSGALEKTETLETFLSRMASSANLKYSIKGDKVYFSIYK